MNVKEIDCRSLECPGPVLKTKEALENQAVTRIRVLVDNDAAAENVSRFLGFQNFEVSVDSDGRTSTVEGHRDQGQSAGTAKPESALRPRAGRPASRKIMVMISADRMGTGDDELGSRLMINYIKTLKEMGGELWRLVFVNSGVKLAVEGSPSMEELSELGASGVDILVCGTCLTHFGLMEAQKVGTTTNMLDIVTSMQLAEKVINL